MSDLEGDWVKAGDQPACAAAYPDRLCFVAPETSTCGTYRGSRGREQGFVRFDAGIFRVEAGDLLLTSATDELVRHGLHLSDDELTLVAPDGCHITYRRDPGTG